ncbi:Spy/CpxP family protein refolding chaperone [Paraglaciecola aquimarina]|uniref:Spy/CpxP family protein refolding chaperone n=1 Tax=Paraglaciecola algarum TaxID=3050085 RepID=A0ABS9D8X5_9ALTE|nr:Spy/CpxP family protein refolding chaperone [Paraglaciecola sp. G1-23]MCF2949326.1 Spy/CpxP family protein refolding chaperone [Paraglaciecola sp. G1-23]
MFNPKMFKLKTIVTPIAICLSLALSSQVMAKPKGGHEGAHKGHSMMKLLSKLSLTDTQKQDIRQIMKQSREDRQASAPSFAPVRQDLSALIQTTDWDQAAVEAAFSQNQEQMAQASLKRAENKHAVLNLLTEEQKDKLATIANKMKDRAAEGDRKGKRKGKAKGKQRGERGNILAFTDEQKAELKSIRTESKASAAELHEKLKAFKQAERELVKSAEFNAEAWLALSNEYKGDFLAMAVLKAKSKHDMWNVMTPEQQAQMLAAKENHKGGKKSMKGHKGMKGKKHQLQES